jgi:hypothetical protein
VNALTGNNFLSPRVCGNPVGKGSCGDRHDRFGFTMEENSTGNPAIRLALCE